MPYTHGSDGVRVSEFNTVFNAHLRRCVTNHVLPVAADTLEFMLARGIPPDTSELQQLLHKLGKQNSWSRARILFKGELRSLCSKLGVFHSVAKLEQFYCVKIKTVLSVAYLYSFI